eukprot:352825-Chlamydomonas_euryale.AAC.20
MSPPDYQGDCPVLHWGCVGEHNPNGTWTAPLPEWHTNPAESHAAGGAWETNFAHVTAADGSSAYVALMMLPLGGEIETGGLSFVVKMPDGQWLRAAPWNANFFLHTSA